MECSLKNRQFMGEMGKSHIYKRQRVVAIPIACKQLFVMEKICRLKAKLEAGYDENDWLVQGGKYTMRKGYE